MFVCFAFGHVANNAIKQHWRLGHWSSCRLFTIM